MVAQLDGKVVRRRPGRGLVRLVSYAFFEGRPLTTRGRWANMLILPFLKGLAALPAPVPVREPCFIVGTGRSGTTILGAILASHRSVSFLNEPKALWHVACGTDDVVGNYSSAAGRFILTGADASPSVKVAFKRLYGWYSALTGRGRVLDKYPECVFRIPFILEIFPDARFVFLVRDGASAATSVQEWNLTNTQQREAGKESWWGLEDRKWRQLVDEVVPRSPSLSGHQSGIAEFTNDLDRAIVEWICAMEAGISATVRYPGRIQMLKYEQLAKQPSAMISRVQEFLGLEQDDFVTAYAEAALRPPRHAENLTMNASLRAAYSRVMKDLGYV